MFYLAIFLILLVFSVLEISNIGKGSHKILIQLAWFILVVVAGTRYETGADWNAYALYLEQVPPISAFLAGGNIGGKGFEFGYFLLCSLLKQFGMGFQWLLFIIALSNVTIITKALKHYTPYVVWGLFVYYALLYVTIEFSLLRQAIAAAICFYSFRYIEEKKLVKYVLLIVLAMSFHRSAIVMLPLYFLLRIRFSNKVLVIIAGIGCLIMLLQIPWIKSILTVVAGFLGEEYADKVTFYARNTTYGVNRWLSIGFFLNLVLLAMFLLNRKLIDGKKYGNMFLNLFMVNLVVYYYAYEILELSIRFRLYFMYSLAVLFPILLEICVSYYNRLIWATVLVLYCFTYNLKLYTNHPTTVVYNPYQNYIVYQVLDKKSIGIERLKMNEEILKKQRQGN